MIPGCPSPENWPNSKFEVVELAGWEEQLGPFYYGERLDSREWLEYRDYFEEVDPDKWPSDGLIQKSVDSFLREARAENLANLAAEGRGKQSQST